MIGQTGSTLGCLSAFVFGSWRVVGLNFCVLGEQGVWWTVGSMIPNFHWRLLNRE